MKPDRTPPVSDALDESARPEPGYDDWKRVKVERALAQSANRETMIPAERVWRGLGLER